MNDINQTQAWDNLEDRIIEKLKPLIEDVAGLRYLLYSGVLLKEMFVRLVTYDELKQYCQETYGEHEGEFQLHQVCLSYQAIHETSLAIDEACGDDDVDSICLAEMLMRKVNENV